MQSRLLRLHIVLAVLLAAVISPCMPGPGMSAPCDMPGCHDMAAMEASCCCRTEGTSTDSEQRVLLPKPVAGEAPAVAMALVPEAPSSLHAPGVAPRAPEPVPLYLLNCSLLA